MSCGCKRLASSCAVLPVRAHWKFVPNRALVGNKANWAGAVFVPNGFPPASLLITSSSSGQIRLGPYGGHPGEAPQALRPAIASPGGALNEFLLICECLVVEGLKKISYALAKTVH